MVWQYQMLYSYQPFGNPSIDQMNTAQDHIYGWATPGATVKVHVHGVFIRDIGTDPSRKMVDTFRI